MVKTNKAMRVASGLLVLTLASTCMISGTFAKYTTSATSTADTAHVAAFGVKIDAQGSTFAEEYATDDSNVSGTIAKSVVSASGNTVAPGTKGDMVSMKLTGTPEVAVNVAYTGAFELNGEWTDGTKFYCPLVIEVNNQPVDTSSCDTAADFADAVNTAIAATGTSHNYAPGTNLGAKADDSLKVTWEWPFDGNDAKDTALGNKSNAPTVSLAVTTTVTQID